MEGRNALDGFIGVEIRLKTDQQPDYERESSETDERRDDWAGRTGLIDRDDPDCVSLDVNLTSLILQCVRGNLQL
jgi:hypothetical protein